MNKRDNSGALFKNEGDRKRENGPDYSGTATIDGVDFYMDAWLKTADSGRKWMSFAFKRKAAPQESQRQAPPARRPPQDDDVPW